MENPTNNTFSTAPSGQGQRVLLALSGGVDSAVCAHLLKEKGYQVEGLVIGFSPAHAHAIGQAQQAARELGIPLHIAHSEDAFDQLVVTPFCHAYASGRTPNPCVICNPNVKFKTLVDIADSLGIHYIATGHYARVTSEDNTFFVARAASTPRDQSYMLYRLPQEVLRRLLLPAGELEKQAIRATASQLQISSADAPDSQEICFIPDGDYASFILNRGIQNNTGRFISPEGEALTAHKGVLHYTVGQRRGLGLSLGKPVFVKRIAANGDILLGYDDSCFADSLIIADIFETVEGGLLNGDYLGKIRSVAPPAPCYLTRLDNHCAKITFTQPQRSPAPGQHLVLYTEDRVVGGGIIDEICR